MSIKIKALFLRALHADRSKCRPSPGAGFPFPECLVSRPVSRIGHEHPLPCIVPQLRSRRSCGFQHLSAAHSGLRSWQRGRPSQVAAFSWLCSIPSHQAYLDSGASVYTSCTELVFVKTNLWDTVFCHFVKKLFDVYCDFK